jgi:hypothetical protein
MYYILQNNIEEGRNYSEFTKDSKFPVLSGKLSVYFLEAPLGLLNMIPDKNNFNAQSLVSPNAMHTGIGFVHESSGMEFAIDYENSDGLLNSLLPEISGSTILWKNKARVNIYKYIDRNYWTRSNYICHIDSYRLGDIKKWIFDDHMKYNYIYVLFAVIKSIDINSYMNPLFKGSTCDSFSLGLIKYISTFSDIKYITPLYTCAQAFITSPENINVVDFETNKVEILNFYKDLSLKIGTMMKKDKEVIEPLQQAMKAENDDIEVTSKILAKLQTIEDLFHTFTDIYLYTYSNTEPGKTVYIKFQNKGIISSYITSDINRNIYAKDIDNKDVIDVYSNPSDKKQKTTNYTLYIISAIILIFIIIFIIFI